MNQIVMIPQNRESTVSERETVGAYGSEDETIDESEIFHKLKTSELLKHLLSVNIKKKTITGAGAAAAASASNKNIDSDSPKPVNIIGNANEYPSAQSVTQLCDSISSSSTISFSSPSRTSCDSFAAVWKSKFRYEDGNMHELQNSKETQLDSNSFSFEEVQTYRDNYQRLFSNESSPSTGPSEQLLPEDDLQALPQELLANETMDLILSEAQRTLNIQSPPSSQGSGEESESCEYTELLPAGESSPFCESTPGGSGFCDSSRCEASPTESDAKKGCDRSGRNVDTGSDSDKDDDIDNEMVLVPSDPLEWTSSHISSWLAWCTRQFSLSPAPEAPRFPPTGRELCALGRGELEELAGGSRGGAVLAKHLAHLRHAVTGRPTSPLQIECREFGVGDHEEGKDEDGFRRTEDD